MKYIFDASAIVNLVKKGRLTPLSDGVTLDLALYEGLNAVLKEHLLIKKLDHDLAARYIDIITRIFDVIEARSIKGLEGEVFNIARDHGLTIYDASYVAVALTDGLTLVTDDNMLREKVGDLIQTIDTSELLSTQPG